MEWFGDPFTSASLFNFGLGSVSHSQKAHTNITKCVDTNDFESLVITGSYDNTVKLWSLDSTLRFKYTYQKHKRPVHSVSFIDHGKLIASCDQNVHVWDPRTQQRLLNLSHENSFKAAQCIDRGTTIGVSTVSNRFWFVYTVLVFCFLIELV